MAAPKAFQATISVRGPMTNAGVSAMSSSIRWSCGWTLGRGTATGWPVVVLGRELVHVGALVVVQAQYPGKGLQHRRRRLDPSLLEAGVVVGTDGGQYGDLLAAQARDPPRTAVGQADGGRVELGAACLEERAEVDAVEIAVHAISVAPGAGVVTGRVLSLAGADGRARRGVS